MPKFLVIPDITGYSVSYEPGELVSKRCIYCGTPYSYVYPNKGEIVKTKCPKIAEKGEKQCGTVWIASNKGETLAEYVARVRGLKEN